MTLPRLILPDTEKETVEAGVLGVGLWKKLVATLKLLGGGSRKQVIEHDGYEVMVEATHQHGKDSGRVRVSGDRYVVIGLSKTGDGNTWLATTGLSQRPLPVSLSYAHNVYWLNRKTYAGYRVVVNTFVSATSDAPAKMAVVIWKPEGGRVRLELNLSDEWWALREEASLLIREQANEYTVGLLVGTSQTARTLIKPPYSEPLDYALPYVNPVFWEHVDFAANAYQPGGFMVNSYFNASNDGVTVKFIVALRSSSDTLSSPKVVDRFLEFSNLLPVTIGGRSMRGRSMRAVNWVPASLTLGVLFYVGRGVYLRSDHPVNPTSYNTVLFVGARFSSTDARVFLYEWPEQDPVDYKTEFYEEYTQAALFGSTLITNDVPFFTARAIFQERAVSSFRSALFLRIGDKDVVLLWHKSDGLYATIIRETGGVYTSGFINIAWFIGIYTTEYGEPPDVRVVAYIRVKSGAVVDVSDRFEIDTSAPARFFDSSWCGENELVVMLNPTFSPLQTNKQRGVYSVDTSSGAVTRIGAAAPNNKVTSDNRATICETGAGCVVLFSENGEDTDSLRLWYCGEEIALRWEGELPPLLAGDIDSGSCKFYENDKGGFFIVVGQTLWLSIRISRDKDGRSFGVSRYNTNPPAVWPNLA